jgi:hypothetical protein
MGVLPAVAHSPVEQLAEAGTGAEIQELDTDRAPTAVALVVVAQRAGTDTQDSYGLYYTYAS